MIDLDGESSLPCKEGKETYLGPGNWVLIFVHCFSWNTKAEYNFIGIFSH